MGIIELLILVLVLCMLFGGGWGYRQGYYGYGPMGIVWILAVVLILVLIFRVI